MVIISSTGIVPKQLFAKLKATDEPLLMYITIKNTIILNTLRIVWECIEYSYHFLIFPKWITLGTGLL